MNTINEKQRMEPQDETDITGTGTGSDATSDNHEEVHTSELSPAVQEYTDYSNEIGTLTTELQIMNQRLDTMTNLSVICMIGIGLVVGVLACNIFARYFIS